MTNVHFPPKWLVDTLNGKHGDPSPQCEFDNNILSLTVFIESGAGMFTKRTRVEHSDNVVFEMTSALHAFLKRIVVYPKVQFRFKNGSLTVVVETPSSALQYRFPKIPMLEPQTIESSDKDLTVTIPADDWVHLWGTIPGKGRVTISSSASSKTLTMKHSGGRWGAAIQTKQSVSLAKSFTCNASAIRETMLMCTPLRVFAKLTFMSVGVLKWTCEDVTVHLAPNE